MAEYVKIGEQESATMYDHFPQIKEVYVFPAVHSERFAVKLLFENGEFRKYVLPNTFTNGDGEVIQYKNHVFTDRIWQTATWTMGTVLV